MIVSGRINRQDFIPLKILIGFPQSIDSILYSIHSTSANVIAQVHAFPTPNCGIEIHNPIRKILNVRPVPILLRPINPQHFCGCQPFTTSGTKSSSNIDFSDALVFISNRKTAMVVSSVFQFRSWEPIMSCRIEYPCFSNRVWVLKLNSFECVRKTKIINILF